MATSLAGVHDGGSLGAGETGLAKTSPQDQVALALAKADTAAQSQGLKASVSRLRFLFEVNKMPASSLPMRTGLHLRKIRKEKWCIQKYDSCSGSRSISPRSRGGKCSRVRPRNAQ